MLSDYPSYEGRRSADLTTELLRQVDAVLIVTDHDNVDYRQVVENASLVADTRNICARLGLEGDHIVKA